MQFILDPTFKVGVIDGDRVRVPTDFLPGARFQEVREKLAPDEFRPNLGRMRTFFRQSVFSKSSQSGT